MPGTTTPSDKKLDKILEKLADLEENLGHKIADVEDQVRNLKWEFMEESRIMKRNFRLLRADFNGMSKSLDRTLQETRKRVKCIEEHLELPPLNP